MKNKLTPIEITDEIAYMTTIIGVLFATPLVAIPGIYWGLMRINTFLGKENKKYANERFRKMNSKKF